MPNWSLYCCWICWSRSCSAWFKALSSCATRLSPLPCGSALSSWGLVLPGYFTLVVWRLNPHCALWHLYSSTPSPNIRQKNFVLVSPIISQGNSRLRGQLSTQIFAFNATAPTLFFAPFREYYRERI